MVDRRPALIVYIALAVIGFIIGGNFINYIFGGILILLFIIISSELISLLKWFIFKTGKLIDIVLFVFAIYLIINKSATIAFSLFYASLGFTLLYGPYVRETFK